MFWKKAKKGAKKIDKLVTGLIIWWALASILWVSQTKQGKKTTKKVGGMFKKSYDVWVEYLGKTVIGVVKFFEKKK